MAGQQPRRQRHQHPNNNNNNNSSPSSAQYCQRCLPLLLLALGILIFLVDVILLELCDLPQQKQQLLHSLSSSLSLRLRPIEALKRFKQQQHYPQLPTNKEEEDEDEEEEQKEENESKENEYVKEEELASTTTTTTPPAHHNQRLKHRRYRQRNAEAAAASSAAAPETTKSNARLRNRQYRPREDAGGGADRHPHPRRDQRRRRHRDRRQELPSQATMDFLSKVGLLDLIHDENMSSTVLDQQAQFLTEHWHVIEERVGGGPVILGLDTCATYRDAIPFRKRIIAPAGIFNSGTNLLSKLLYDNCWITQHPNAFAKADHAHIHWQVNWGKHTPAYFRYNHSVEKDIPNRRYLPIVTTRDPYSWLQTMCRVRYSVHWFHHAAEHCPNLVPNEIDRLWFYKVLRREIPYTKRNEPWLYDNLHDLANYTPDLDHVPVRVRFKAGNLYFHNLLDVWNHWYHAYYDNFDNNNNNNDPSSSSSSNIFPRLIVRLEDLVVYPQEVITKVCECVGGRVVDHFRHAVDSAKPGDENVHGTIKTNRLDAMIKLIRENRTGGMTLDDKAFCKTHLSDRLLQAFHYSHPVV